LAVDQARRKGRVVRERPFLTAESFKSDVGNNMPMTSGRMLLACYELMSSHRSIYAYRRCEVGWMVTMAFSGCFNIKLLAISPGGYK
jgi:hypothetical protein